MCTSSPPIGGPDAAATPPIAAQIPIAAGRCGRELGEQKRKRGRHQQRRAGCLDHARGHERGTDGAAPHSAEPTRRSPAPAGTAACGRGGRRTGRRTPSAPRPRSRTRSAPTRPRRRSSRGSRARSWECDVDDEQVEADHEHADRDERETFQCRGIGRPPAVAICNQVSHASTPVSKCNHLRYDRRVPYRPFTDQNCSVAARSRVVGERWTLLVMREVLLRPPAVRGDQAEHRDRPEHPQRPAPDARRPRAPRASAVQRASRVLRVRADSKGLDLNPVIDRADPVGRQVRAAEAGPPRVPVHTACGHDARSADALQPLRRGHRAAAS